MQAVSIDFCKPFEALSKGTLTRLHTTLQRISPLGRVFIPENQNSLLYFKYHRDRDVKHNGQQCGTSSSRWCYTYFDLHHNYYFGDNMGWSSVLRPPPQTSEGATGRLHDRFSTGEKITQVASWPILTTTISTSRLCSISRLDSFVQVRLPFYDI
jgi:hypothetical protein